TLPSGRAISYPGARLAPNTKFEDGDPDIEFFDNARGQWKPARAWFGTLCLAGDALVLTESGWLRIDQLKLQRVWDGEDFVAHSGVICNGLHRIIDYNGVGMTPNHKVLTTEGWQDAESTGHNRAPVRLPDGYSLPVARQRTRVANSLRLRQRNKTIGQTVYSRRLQVVRMHDISNAIASAEGSPKAAASHPRHVASSGLCGLALDARPLSIADTSSLAQLRRTWDHG